MDMELQQFKAEFFKALAHPLRIRIIEILGEGDKAVSEIQSVLGSEGSAVSQQLAILRAKNIVVGTKEANRVVYALRDPLVSEVLLAAKKVFNNHLIDVISILDRVNKED